MGWVCFYERLEIIGKFQHEAAVRERQQQSDLWLLLFTQSQHTIQGNIFPQKSNPLWDLCACALERGGEVC